MAPPHTMFREEIPPQTLDSLSRTHTNTNTTHSLTFIYILWTLKIARTSEADMHLVVVYNNTKVHLKIDTFGGKKKIIINENRLVFRAKSKKKIENYFFFFLY